ncbi:hypothetical protein BHYA_0004g00990 [Botrytis hyacinthi]|uniref:Uncharacterized protein n=1 Tax=Botrytis hyacinthi TaxID=278943 RepID=A0A4Z1HD09_9HELO|nr:hypothetical protein BHYA_0004g00990 [Botrytis hyacinthi]
MPITPSDSTYDSAGSLLTTIQSSRFIEGTGRDYNTTDPGPGHWYMARENMVHGLQALVNDKRPPVPQVFAACSDFQYIVTNERGVNMILLQVFNCHFLKTAQAMVNTETCSIYAGWRSSEFFIDPKVDQYAHSPDLTDPTKDMEDWARAIDESRDYPMRNVQIDIDWANLALPLNYTILSTAISFTGYQAMPLGLTVSSLIPDAMSRIRRSGEISIPLIESEASEQNHDQDKYTYITVNRFRYGYSYSLRGITRWLALSILLLHIFLALAHTVIITRMGWTSKILKSLCEILVLAINSSPSAVLDNTCGGVEILDTYKHIVEVRETSFEHLGLVMNGDEDKHTEKVVIDKEYGSLDKKETFHFKVD